MTIPINTIVEVNISRQTQAIAQEGFGVPLVVGEHSYFTERIRFVSSIAELTGLGFLTSDVEYKLASAAFGQDPKPSRIAVGRKVANVSGVTTIDFSVDFIVGNIINLKVNGVSISPVTFATSHALTIGAVASAIAALAGVSSAVVTGNDIAVTFTLGTSGSISDVLVTGGASQPTALIVITTPAVTYASELDLIAVASEDFYAVLLKSSLDNDILAAAEWVQSHTPKKILSVRTSDASVLTAATTDIASKLKAKGYDRTFISYHAVANEFLDAAILGKMLPLDPGSATFKFKTLTGISADSLTSGQTINSAGKKCNLYLSIGGVSIFTEGVLSSGEFIDVIIGLDWLTARIQERVYAQLVKTPKIPYTDAGVGIIENEIKAQLQDAIAQGVLASNPAPQTTVPKVAAVSPLDKAARFLPNVRFTGTLAGAIHKVQINGIVTI